MGITMLVYSQNTYLLPIFNREIEVRVGYGVYSDNSSLAVVLMCREADIDEDLLDDEDYVYDESAFDEIIATITVNLESSINLPVGEQYIDVNNYPLIASWLIENNLATPSGGADTGGHILYPAYKFQIPPDYTERLESSRGE
jgi:hypothetical protein